MYAVMKERLLNVFDPLHAYRLVMVQMDSEHRLNKFPPPAVRLIFLLNSCSDVCGWPVATYTRLHYHGNWMGDVCR